MDNLDMITLDSIADMMEKGWITSPSIAYQFGFKDVLSLSADNRFKHPAVNKIMHIIYESRIMLSVLS